MQQFSNFSSRKKKNGNNKFVDWIGLDWMTHLFRDRTFTLLDFNEEETKRIIFIDLLYNILFVLVSFFTIGSSVGGLVEIIMKEKAWQLLLFSQQFKPNNNNRLIIS